MGVERVKSRTAARRAAGLIPDYRARRPERHRPCVHLGGPTGERRLCPSCRGAVEIKLLSCGVFGACSPAKEVPGAAWCRSCARYEPEPYPEIKARDLAYHVYPVKNGRWRWNVRQLLQRVRLFNGRRVVAVATDGGTDDPAEVLAAFGGEIDVGDVLAFANDPSLREVLTHGPMLERLESRDPSRALLWAHAKGVTKPDDPAVRRWAEALYEVMLGRWPAVARVLAAHPVAGCFRWLRRMWPEHSASDWAYSGSWCWYRSAELFARDWRRIDRFWTGVEPYPSLHFSRAEAGVVFGDGEVNLYELRAWESVGPALDAWLHGRVGDRTEAFLGG